MYLLDINVLIARADPAHEHHERAREWFSEKGDARWATCPITENGFVRILGHVSYPGGPGSPRRAANLLLRLTTRIAGHRFITDSVSLLNATSFPELAGVGSKHVTDVYLLSLAVDNNLRLVTFDRRIDPAVVTGGPAAHEALL